MKVLLAGLRHINSRLFRMEFMSLFSNKRETIVNLWCNSKMYGNIRKHYNDSGSFSYIPSKNPNVFGQVYGVNICVDNTIGNNEINLEYEKGIPCRPKQRKKKL